MASQLIMFLNLGATELILIVLVVLLLFGAKKIPELARGMGRGIREFKDASREIKREIESEPSSDPTKVRKPE
jgi:sec-independent protein translocase protein TatA